jgi:hypothetical protein
MQAVRWVVVALVMVVAGAGTYLGSVLVLAELGSQFFGNKDALLYSDVGGWAACGALGMAIAASSVAFLAPMAYSLRQRPKQAARAAIAIGAMLVALGLVARILGSEAGSFVSQIVPWFGLTMAALGLLFLSVGQGVLQRS